MAENYCIITKKEFDEFKNKSSKYEYYAREFKNLEKENDTLKKEISELKAKSSIGINVVGLIGEYEDFRNVYHTVFNKLSEENLFKYTLELDKNSIIPQGKIRSVMMNTFEKLKDYMITHTKEYVDKYYEKRVEDIKKGFDKKTLELESEIKRLKKIIDNHNRKCYFDIHKLKY